MMSGHIVRIGAESYVGYVVPESIVILTIWTWNMSGYTIDKHS